MESKPKCLFPFIFLELHPQGKVFCCCPAWTKAGPVGNLYQQSIVDIWNGEKIRNIRKKVYEGQYQRICKLNYCPYIKNPVNLETVKKQAGSRLKAVIKQIKQKKVFLKTKPLIVSLAHSGTCNLRCKMCLSHQGFNPPEPKLEQIIFKKTLPQLLPHLKFIKLSGNGEPFAQPSTFEFMQTLNQEKFPQLEFKILTNSLLLNRPVWNSVKHLNIHTINVSVDAASQNTYEKIRIGGRWSTLQKNLGLISKLRKKREIKEFIINMTVMKSNYFELKKFAQMGLKLGCDRVHFRKIFGWQNLEENINYFPTRQIWQPLKNDLADPVFDQPAIDIRALKEYQNSNISLWQELLAQIKLILLTPAGRLAKNTWLRQVFRPLANIKRKLF